MKCLILTITLEKSKLISIWQKTGLREQMNTLYSKQEMEKSEHKLFLQSNSFLTLHTFYEVSKLASQYLRLY